MAVYAIGDVQGCYDPLRRLLDRLRFEPARDKLYFVGDLVNRGPQSLATLRFIHALGESAQSVLGNHDIHLLALAAGIGKPKAGDTLDPVLQAADRDELLNWLRRRPLLIHDEALNFVIVHAGLAPQWDLATAKSCAAEVQAALQADNTHELFAQLYGNQPDRWHEQLSGMARLRFSINALTRMRYCSRDGRLDFRAKGKPGTQVGDLVPWFEFPQRANRDVNIVFGHWSTLGEVHVPGVYGIDTGCVWGNGLSALELNPVSGQPRLIAQPCDSSLSTQ